MWVVRSTPNPRPEDPDATHHPQRHAGDLAAILQDQHARKLDVIAPATSIYARQGVLNVRGTEPVISDDGVTTGDGQYVPTVVCDEGVAEALRIPVAYVKRLRSEAPDLYDANVNGWLHGRTRRAADGTAETVREADGRSFLVRCFRGDDGEPGVARALLSDRYRMIDNLDVLTAALDGVRASGIHVDIAGCDLTERRMRVRVRAPEVAALAPDLLRGYRSPFTGATGADNPTVFAGFEIGNSETGGGAFTIVPRLEVQVCTNGMRITKDALRSVHLGARMDDGVVRWSDATQQKNLELVTAQARDAVATFLDVEYVRRVIADVEARSGRPVQASQVETVCARLRFSQEHIAGILDHFALGGDATAGGLMNAATSLAQTINDPDVAAQVEERAMAMLEAV